MKILEETNDGFKIAEADLKLRGPGELLGQQQSGPPKLRFGNLAEDLNLIRQARELVAKSIRNRRLEPGDAKIAFSNFSSWTRRSVGV